MSKLNYKGPVVLVVMDGVGLSDNEKYNAVKQAHLETLHSLMEKYPTAKLGAAGEYVGIPKGDMGNSEVGHNAMGAGEIVLQRSAAVENDVNTGEIFNTKTWLDIVERIHQNNSTLHFMGIFSDGNVHSNISHLEKMMAQAQKDGIERIRVHALIDGRDVPPHSEPKYIQRLEKFVHELGDPDYKIASGGGRMVITCDRYENDWGMVEKGWHTHVLGEGRQFASATEAIETFRKETKDLQDQYMPAFVIAKDGEPIGKIQDGDAVVYIDFRADRAIEMAQAFTYNDFPFVRTDGWHLYGFPTDQLIYAVCQSTDDGEVDYSNDPCFWVDGVGNIGHNPFAFEFNFLPYDEPKLGKSTYVRTCMKDGEYIYSMEWTSVPIDDPEAIDKSIYTNNSPKGPRLYDLQGRRLQHVPTKGVYIQDGKKYIK